jgi:hypothetical protein
VTDGKNLEGSCSTGQSLQRAAVPVEKEEELFFFLKIVPFMG